MKKSLKITIITFSSILILILAALIIFPIVLQNVGNRSAEKLPYENFALNSKITANSSESGLKKVVDGKSSTYKSKGSKFQTIFMDFEKQIEFNTIVIKETMQLLRNPVWIWGAIQEFKIYKNNGDDWEMFYKSDGVGDYKYAAFPKITTDKLKFEFQNETKTIQLKEIEVYNTPQKDKSLRINEYIVTSYDDEKNIKMLEKLEDYCHITTDFTLMAGAFYNSDGGIQYYMGEDYKDEFEKSVSQVMALAKNYNIKVFINLFSNYVDEQDYMFRDKVDELVNSALEMVLKYGFDGVDIDWEYPRNKEQLKQFDNYLIKLKEKFAPYNKKISISTGAWNVDFSEKAWDALDHVAIMVYDQVLADRVGNHSSFYCSMRDIETMRKKGCPMEKLELGTPFYGKILRERTANGESFNADYTDILTTNRFDNYANGTKIDENGKVITDWVGFNSYQMVYDKVAYIIELGLGGMMTWTMSTDKEYSNPLSLHRAIEEAMIVRGFGIKG